MRNVFKPALLIILILILSGLYMPVSFASDAFPAPRQPAPNNGEGLLMQQWIIDAYGSDGASLRVIFELSNFSEKDRLKEMTGQTLKSVASRIIAEYTSSDGKRRRVEQAAGGDWSFNSSKQLLGIASSSLKREKSEFKLEFESDDMRINIALRPLDGPWKPSAAGPLVGNINSRYFDLVFFAPRAEVKGAVRLREVGESVEKRFSGDAVMTYQVSNMRSYELLKRRMDFSYFDKKNTVIFGGLAQPSKMSGLGQTWLYIKGSGGVALNSVKNRVKFWEKIEGEHYALPRSVEIDAAALKLKLTVDNIVRRIEGVDDRENTHGFVARQFSKPVEYELECSVSMEGKGAVSDLKSFKPRCSMLYLNQ